MIKDEDEPEITRPEVMSMILMVLIIMFLCVSTQGCCSGSFQPWTKKDLALELVGQTAIMADCLQTISIAKNPDKWGESSPMLPYHPTVEQVVFGCFSYSELHALITWALPPDKRWVWQATTLIISIDAVYHNHRKEVGYSLP